MEKAMKGHGQWKFTLEVSTPFYDIYSLCITTWENYYSPKRKKMYYFSYDKSEVQPQSTKSYRLQWIYDNYYEIIVWS